MKTDEVLFRYLSHEENGHSSNTCIIETNKLCAFKSGYVLMRRLEGTNYLVPSRNTSKHPDERIIQQIREYIKTIKGRYISAPWCQLLHATPENIAIITRLISIYDKHPEVIYGGENLWKAVDNALYLKENWEYSCNEQFRILAAADSRNPDLIPYLKSTNIENQELLTQQLVHGKLTMRK